jgi:hypothetical protein
MLRTHRNLEDLLCNPVMKMMMMIMRFFCFSILMEHWWNEIDVGNRSARTLHSLPFNGEVFKIIRILKNTDIELGQSIMEYIIQ